MRRTLIALYVSVENNYGHACMNIQASRNFRFEANFREQFDMFSPINLRNYVSFKVKYMNLDHLYSHIFVGKLIWT